MDKSTILVSEGVEAGYGDARILHGVSIKVEKSTIVAIIGPNGSGKSTYLKTVIGQVRHLKGTTRFRDGSGEEHDITNARSYVLPQLGIGYVPQLSNVFADMSVLENLQLGALPIARDKPLVRRRTESVLEQFPVLRGRIADRAGTLSGGQRQMLAMARALMPDPTLLILDEPSAGIQPDLVDGIFAAIRDFATSGTSVLLVEQKARQALEFSDFAYVLEMGRNRFKGPGPELAEDPAVIDLYLGAGRLPDLDDMEPADLQQSEKG